jgi:hypothetical protein
MGGQRQDPTDLTQGKDTGTHSTGGKVGPAENLALTGIRSRNRPTRSETLHRLSHPGPRSKVEEYLTHFLPHSEHW